jgi:2-iminobutanoate/2-iminopropanoate deaminase
MTKIISTMEAPAVIGPYSQAVRAGSLVFCAGQVPLDPKSGAIVSEDIAEQTTRALVELVDATHRGHQTLDLALILRPQYFL